MLTPIEIHNKEFPTKFKGYDPEEVNDYLDEVIRTVEQLIRENKDLEKRVKFNEEKVSYFNSIQETLNKSIIVAQEAADRLKENARKDAEIIIFEAEKEAERLLKEAAEKATEINRETDVLKKETRMFRQRLQIMVESQLEMIKNEEWDLLLNSHSKIEVSAPSIESIIAGRAKKNEKLITDVLDNTGEAAYTYTTKGVGIIGVSKDFSEEAGKIFPAYNPQKAKQLLAEGLKEEGMTKMPELEVIFADTGSTKMIAQYIQENLSKNLGIKLIKPDVNVSLSDFSVYKQDIIFVATVAILILVFLIQFVGDYAVKRIDKR